MTAIATQETVGEIVARRPALSRVFEEAGIDCCCGGKATLDDACKKKGLDPAAFAERLAHAESAADDAPATDAASMTLTELADHIEQTHHVYLRGELPRLMQMTQKVASVHGESDARLYDVQRVFAAMADELFAHMMKEERVLFPMVRALEAGGAPVFHCGSIANPIRQMEHEHDDAGNALARLRALTEGFSPPAGACNTYRAMLDALAHLERDLHLHIHKENNVLFPRAIEAESLRPARV